MDEEDNDGVLHIEMGLPSPLASQFRSWRKGVTMHKEPDLELFTLFSLTLSAQVYGPTF